MPDFPSSHEFDFPDDTFRVFMTDICLRLMYLRKNRDYESEIMIVALESFRDWCYEHKNCLNSELKTMINTKIISMDDEIMLFTRSESLRNFIKKKVEGKGIIFRTCRTDV